MRREHFDNFSAFYNDTVPSGFAPDTGIDADADIKADADAKTDARLQQDKVFQLSIRGEELPGLIDNAVSAAARAANPNQDKSGKKDKKNDLVLHLMLLNEKIANLNSEIAALDEQIDALQDLKALAASGDLDINNSEHQDLLRQARIPQSQWGDVDGDMLDKLLETAQQEREAKQDARNEKQKELEEITQSRDASTLDDVSNDTKNNVTTELGDDLALVNEIDKKAGFNEDLQTDAMTALSDPDDLFSDDFSFDDTELESDTVTSSTSYADSMDDKSLFDRENISGEFTQAALGVNEQTIQPTPDADLQNQINNAPSGPS